MESKYGSGERKQILMQRLEQAREELFHASSARSLADTQQEIERLERILRGLE